MGQRPPLSNADILTKLLYMYINLTGPNSDTIAHRVSCLSTISIIDRLSWYTCNPSRVPAGSMPAGQNRWWWSGQLETVMHN